jgi:hypothetical protein
MPLFPYRAAQPTDTTGTGTLTLNAASASRRSFNAALGASARIGRFVASLGDNWEAFVGSYNGASPGTLTRATVLASSAGGSPVSFGAGTKDVLYASGPLDREPYAVSGTTNLVLADLDCILNYTGTGGHNVNLPAVATVPPGAGYLIKHRGSGILTIDPSGAETVDGATTVPVAPGESCEVRVVGSEWVTSGLPTGFRRLSRTVLSAVFSSPAILMPAAFSRFRLTLQNMTVGTAGAAIVLRFSSDGGSTFLATTDYTAFGILAGGTSALAKYALVSQTSIVLTTTLIAGGTGKHNGLYELWGGDAGTLAGVAGNYALGVNTTGPEQTFGAFSGMWAGTAALMNAIQLLSSTGTSTITGTIVLEGQI